MKPGAKSRVQSVDGERSEGNRPDSAEDEDTDMRLEDRGVQKGKQKMV